MALQLQRRKSRATIDHPSDVASKLSSDGFAVILGSEVVFGTETHQSFEALVASFDDLPADQYDDTGLRSRRYSRFIYTPWADHLVEVPSVSRDDDDLVVEYFQPVSLNSTDGGERRPFTPLHPATRSNLALHELIRFDYWTLPTQTKWEGLPVLIGVHQIKQSPKWGTPSVSSPNHLHRDGEPFTYVHLMKRENITGGLNYVAAPYCVGFLPDDVEQSAIYKRFTLEKLLDSFVIDDQMVSHHVDEVHPIFQHQKAVRAVFLIDFTPMMPQFV